MRWLGVQETCPTCRRKAPISSIALLFVSRDDTSATEQSDDHVIFFHIFQNIVRFVKCGFFRMGICNSS